MKQIRAQDLNHRPITLFSICLVCVVLFELLSRLLISNGWILSTTPYVSPVRWRLQWLKEHSIGKSAASGYDEYDSLLGWRPKNNSTTVTPAGITVHFNSSGIRGIREYPETKPLGTKRIAVMGDSYAFGSGVSDENTFASKLGTLLPNTEVLNFGVHGYGIDQMALRLKSEALKFHPDIVIVAFIGDDITRTAMTFRDYMKPVYSLKNGILILSNIPVRDPESLLDDSMRIPSSVEFVRLLADRVTYGSFTMDRQMPLVSKIWDSVISQVRESRAIPVFLYLPVPEEISADSASAAYLEKTLFSYCMKKSVSCFSARKYLSTDGNSRTGENPVSSHYDPAIHDLIARGLAEDLIALIREK